VFISLMSSMEVLQVEHSRLSLKVSTLFKVVIKPTIVASTLFRKRLDSKVNLTTFVKLITKLD
jgi:hypothetical protein